MNANVLDYLLAHPELIPEDWKNKYVFFWGTIYRYSSGGLRSLPLLEWLQVALGRQLACSRFLFGLPCRARKLILTLAF